MRTGVVGGILGSMYGPYGMVLGALIGAAITYWGVKKSYE